MTAPHDGSSANVHCFDSGSAPLWFRSARFHHTSVYTWHVHSGSGGRGGRGGGLGGGGGDGGGDGLRQMAMHAGGEGAVQCVGG